MMGAGKSAVGAILHNRTGLDCIDLDQLAEVRAGMTIAEIFARFGEKNFRDLETLLLANLPSDKPAIVITGGGVVLREENRARLRRLGQIVWLDADEAVLFERAMRHSENVRDLSGGITNRKTRPLLQSDDPRRRFSEIYRARQPVYAELADVRIDTSRLAPDEIAGEILVKMKSSE